jgi:signal transduction histidine kinase
VVVKRLGAGAIIVATGIVVAAPNLLLFESSGFYGLAASVLGVALGLAILAAGVLLYRSDISTQHALRVAGWNVLGVVVLGIVLVLASRYPGTALPLPIAASVLGVSAVAHILIGVNDVRRIRVGELARERRKLAVLNRLARHNLRNQAQVLTSAGEIAAEHVSDDTGAEATARVTNAASRIATINEKLKRFQEATEQPPAADPRPVEAMVTDVVGTYRDEYPDADITVDVPSDTTRTTPHLATALDELLENAFEHGEAATGSVSVRVTTTGQTVELTVDDDGPGVPQEEWDIVSGDIEQSQLQHASGLGLWVVKAVAEGVDGGFRLGDDRTAVTVSVPSAGTATYRGA